MRKRRRRKMTQMPGGSMVGKKGSQVNVEVTVVVVVVIVILPCHSDNGKWNQRPSPLH